MNTFICYEYSKYKENKDKKSTSANADGPHDAV